MKNIIKHLFILASVLIISSCCKEGDCKCDPNCGGTVEKPSYWEHFIAHAGGAIDGLNYTNCLEALDLSYSKGCKLFEIDLSPTTDGKLVGSHGPPGVTEEEFMNRLIAGKYTPLNMERINDWFRRHPDAILITDKLRHPQRIYDEFLFLDRVIMELFDWDEVDKAIELGIKPMLSGNLIFGNSKKAMEMGVEPLSYAKNFDIEKIIEEKKIEYICTSRIYEVPGNEELLKRLKAKGIKNYVYHLEWGTNGEPAEQYVWDNEMDYCYGMYANDLDLLVSLLNQNLKVRRK
jgi:hypothetical protein